MIGRNPPELAAERLAFIQALSVRIESIRATTDREVTEGRAQRDFSLIVSTAASSDSLMTGDAFQRTRSRREPQVQIAALCSECAQRTYRNGAHATACARETLQTNAGIPRSLKYCIQRR